MKIAFNGYEGKLRASFAAQSMMRSLGARMVRVAPGEVAIEAPVRAAEFGQQHGFAHAAVAFAVGDSAAGYAALSLMEEKAEVLTVEMKINLLAPARGPLLRAEGRVIRAGRRLVVVGAKVLNVDGDTATEAAVLQGTMIPIESG